MKPFPADDDLLTPIQFGNHTVPGLWRFLLPYQAFTLKVPEQRESTCLSCPRTATDGYRVDYRCCTYHPKVPNFLLGLALQDKDCAPMVSKVREQGWLLPDAFQSTPQQWASFLADTADDVFGRSKRILCPFLKQENGFCQIYPYRNSVCSTFFCRNDHNERGQAFWDDLQTLVMQIELGLAQWALNAVGFDVDSYIERMNSLDPRKVAQSSNDCWNEDTRRFLWGDEFGKEFEVYRACADAIFKHRHELWQIVGDLDIQDSTKFDRNSVKVVPKKYRSEIDEDHGQEADTESPHNIWQDVLRQYRKMWQVPGGALVVHPKVSIEPNRGRDAEEKHFHTSPFVVTRRKRKSGKAAEWKAFATAEQAAALDVFQTPKAATLATCELIRSRISTQEPLEFIAEWYARGALELADGDS